MDWRGLVRQDRRRTTAHLSYDGAARPPGPRSPRRCRCARVSSAISSSDRASTERASRRSVRCHRTNSITSTGTSATSAMNQSRSPARCWSRRGDGNHGCPTACTSDPSSTWFDTRSTMPGTASSSSSTKASRNSTVTNVELRRTPGSDSGPSTVKPSTGTDTVMSAAHTLDSRTTADSGVSSTAKSTSPTTGATIALPSTRIGRECTTRSATADQCAGPPRRSRDTGAARAAKVGTAKNNRASRSVNAHRSVWSYRPTMPNCSTAKSSSATRNDAVRQADHRAPRRRAPTSHQP